MSCYRAKNFNLIVCTNKNWSDVSFRERETDTLIWEHNTFFIVICKFHHNRFNAKWIAVSCFDMRWRQFHLWNQFVRWYIFRRKKKQLHFQESHKPQLNVWYFDVNEMFIRKRGVFTKLNVLRMYSTLSFII